ncbi:MAG: hypothetical protein HY344_00885 [Candidatus Levybacteria bacterium]|nr:hypothetical protein [Candidatus Levybacteria bacterium]
MFNPAEMGPRLKGILKSPKTRRIALAGSVAATAAACAPLQQFATRMEDAFPCDNPPIAAVDGGATIARTDPVKLPLPRSLTGGEDIFLCFPTGEQISVEPTARPSAHTKQDMIDFVTSEAKKDHPAIGFNSASGTVERYFGRDDVKERTNVNPKGMLNKCENGSPQVPAEYMDQYRSGECAKVTLALSKQVLQDPTQAGFNTFKVWVNYTLNERDFGNGDGMRKLTLGMLNQ